MKKSLTVFGFLALIYSLAALLFFSSCKTPLGCQDTGEMSGYVPNGDHIKIHMKTRKPY